MKNFSDYLKAEHSRHQFMTQTLAKSAGTESDLPKQTFSALYVQPEISEGSGSNRRPVLTNKLFQTAQKSEKRVRRILVEGEAGSGKSTMLDYIANQWGLSANNDQPLGKGFDYVIKVRLSTLLNTEMVANIGGKSTEKLASFIKRLLVLQEEDEEEAELRTITHETDLKEVKQTLSTEKCLLLVDDLDQTLHLNTANHVFRKIFDQMTDSQEAFSLIVFSRPITTLEASVKEKFDRILNLSDYSDKSIHLSIEKFFKAQEAKGHKEAEATRKHLIEFLKCNRSVIEQIKRPLILSTVCQVAAQNNPSFIRKDFVSPKIYERVLFWLSAKFNQVEHHSDKFKQQSFSLKNFFEQTPVLEVLKQVAFYRLRNDLERIHGRVIEEMINKHNVKLDMRSLWKLGLLSIETAPEAERKAKKVNLSELVFKFNSVRFEQFLCAHYIRDQLSQLKDEKKLKELTRFLGKNRNRENFLPVLKFTSTLLLEGKLSQNQMPQQLKKKHQEEFVQGMDAFWSCMSCNIDGIIELNIEPKVRLLMNLIGTVQQYKSVIAQYDDIQSLHNSIVVLIDKTLSQKLGKALWKETFEISGYSTDSAQKFLKECNQSRQSYDQLEKIKAECHEKFKTKTANPETIETCKVHGFALDYTRQKLILFEGSVYELKFGSQNADQIIQAMHQGLITPTIKSYREFRPLFENKSKYVMKASCDYKNIGSIVDSKLILDHESIVLSFLTYTGKFILEPITECLVERRDELLGDVIIYKINKSSKFAEEVCNPSKNDPEFRGRVLGLPSNEDYFTKSKVISPHEEKLIDIEVMKRIGDSMKTLQFNYDLMAIIADMVGMSNVADQHSCTKVKKWKLLGYSQSDNEALNARISEVENLTEYMGQVLDTHSETLLKAGVEDEAQIVMAIEKLEEESPNMGMYYRVFYWTLSNYIHSFTVSSTGVFKKDLDNEKSGVAGAAEKAASFALKLGEGLPLVGGFIELLDGVIQGVSNMVYGHIVENKEIAINNIVKSKMTDERDISRVSQKIAIRVIEYKRSRILQPVEQEQDSNLMKVVNFFEEGFESLKSSLIEEKVTEFGHGDLVADMAMQDVALLLGFIYTNSEKIMNSKVDLVQQLEEGFKELDVDLQEKLDPGITEKRKNAQNGAPSNGVAQTAMGQNDLKVIPMNLNSNSKTHLTEESEPPTGRSNIQKNDCCNIY